MIVRDSWYASPVYNFVVFRWLLAKFFWFVIFHPFCNGLLLFKKTEYEWLKVWSKQWNVVSMQNRFCNFLHWLVFTSCLVFPAWCMDANVIFQICSFPRVSFCLFQKHGKTRPVSFYASEDLEHRQFCLVKIHFGNWLKLVKIHIEIG